jgi:hypothetical protein
MSSSAILIWLRNETILCQRNCIRHQICWNNPGLGGLWSPSWFLRCFRWILRHQWVHIISSWQRLSFLRIQFRMLRQRRVRYKNFQIHNKQWYGVFECSSDVSIKWWLSICPIQLWAKRFKVSTPEVSQYHYNFGHNLSFHISVCYILLESEINDGWDGMGCQNYHY